MRDPMTGEDITDDPERWVDWREDPMLGRWNNNPRVIQKDIRITPANESVQGALMAWLNEEDLK